MVEEVRSTTRSRPDGRRALLTYLDPDLIKDLKVAALEDGKNVYELVEQAARDWLDRRPKPPRKRASKRKAG